jgi:hypothetical protein
MANNIALLRGRAKERVCPFVMDTAGFKQNMRDQEVIQANLVGFLADSEDSERFKAFSL